MFNYDGVRTADYIAPKQILANVEFQYSVGCRVPQSLGVDVTANGVTRKIVKAGTPLVIDFGDINAVASAPTGPTRGFFTLQITTAFANDESITIDGVTYTKKATESVANKQFSGANAAAQVTSLLKMVETDDYDVAAVSGATDKIGFTQKEVNTSDTSGPTASKTSSTGAIGSVTRVMDPSLATDGNAVLLHDVIVTEGTKNGTALIFGFVNYNRLDADVQAKVTPGPDVIGKVSFLSV